MLFRSHGLGAPSLPDLKLQRPKLSLEGKGLATACEAPWAPPSGLCPDTAVSTRPPESLGAQDGHEGLNSVTFIQSVILFLLPMSGDRQGISGLDEPSQA